METTTTKSTSSEAVTSDISHLETHEPEIPTISREPSTSRTTSIDDTTTETDSVTRALTTPKVSNIITDSNKDTSNDTITGNDKTEDVSITSTTNSYEFNDDISNSVKLKIPSKDLADTVSEGFDEDTTTGNSDELTDVDVSNSIILKIPITDLPDTVSEMFNEDTTTIKSNELDDIDISSLVSLKIPVINLADTVSEDFDEETTTVMQSSVDSIVDIKPFITVKVPDIGIENLTTDLSNDGNVSTGTETATGAEAVTGAETATGTDTTTIARDADTATASTSYINDNNDPPTTPDSTLQSFGDDISSLVNVKIPDIILDDSGEEIFDELVTTVNHLNDESDVDTRPFVTAKIPIIDLENTTTDLNKDPGSQTSYSDLITNVSLNNETSDGIKKEVRIEDSTYSINTPDTDTLSDISISLRNSTAKDEEGIISEKEADREVNIDGELNKDDLSVTEKVDQLNNEIEDEYDEYSEPSMETKPASISPDLLDIDSNRSSSTLLYPTLLQAIRYYSLK